jgi:hypothetical protein
LTPRQPNQVTDEVLKGIQALMPVVRPHVRGPCPRFWAHVVIREAVLVRGKGSESGLDHVVVVEYPDYDVSVDGLQCLIVAYLNK